MCFGGTNNEKGINSFDFIYNTFARECMGSARTEVQS